MTARSFIMVVLCLAEVVDTMGAGDSFIAGFLYAICEGKGIQEAMAGRCGQQQCDHCLFRRLVGYKQKQEFE